MADQSTSRTRRMDDSDRESDRGSHKSPRHHSPSHSPSARGSASPSHARSSGSASPSHARPAEYAQRFDGNRDPAAQAGQAPVVNRNIDAGVVMWGHVKGHKIQIPKRPNPTTIGRDIAVGLNTYNVVQFPAKPVYQYNVLIGSGSEKKPLIKKLWLSKAVQGALPSQNSWIFDGEKIAYSNAKVDSEIRVNVDLDAEQGRQPKAGRPNTHRVVIKRTTTIDFTVLDAYLKGRADFDTKCLEAINFADHLLREFASQRLTAIKRSFFQAGQTRFDLGGGIEAFKGVYQSMRIAHQPGNNHCLTVNVDVSNGTFWRAGPLSNAVAAVLNTSPNNIAGATRSEGALRQLKRLRRVQVYTDYRGTHDNYTIDRFLDQTANSYTFTNKDANGRDVKMSIAQYFQQKYNTRLQHPDWPLVQMTKKNCVVPIEVLKLEENQRFNFKLDERQTSQMIRFAVTPPKDRWDDINRGVQMLNWGQDPYLAAYGMKINPNPVVTKGRLLQNPKVAFANGENNPGTTGRWDLRGKKFLTASPQPLKAWGVVLMPGRFRADEATVKRFISSFVTAYEGHGGKVASREPVIVHPASQDVGEIVGQAWQKIGNHFTQRPQMIVFMLQDKNTIVYGRIKKSCECRFGVVSQCVQYQQVQKCQAQYISNVLMKFNAKLGGSTARAVGPTTAQGIFREPTMIVGVDISHPAPSGQSADSEKMSTLAMTVSLDRYCTRYSAMVNSNGYRVEMVQTENWTKLFKPQVINWISTIGGGKLPKTIIYFRDGVSEGQFSSVINQEVRDMRELLNQHTKDHGIKFMVIIASKRHHVRFFPRDQSKDKNGNPLPGTLVESGVTHPYENDFFLCSHSAIKGTARPTHYHVLLNEPNMPNEQIQTLIYEHCYQFIRSTTPVSLFPAVYYADIAALRAKYHDSKFANQDRRGTAQGGSQAGGAGGPSGSSEPEVGSSVPDLLQMPTEGGINSAMWYV
ncbi:hypothetical protein MBLNU457_4905t1 [Dothideomycetes sp. NU457]